MPYFFRMILKAIYHKKRKQLKRFNLSTLINLQHIKDINNMFYKLVTLGMS